MTAKAKPEDARHLHGDYHFSFCGLDASHIRMTHEPDECTCQLCHEYAAGHEQQMREHAEAIELAAAREAEAEEAARAEAAAAQEERLRSIEARLAATPVPEPEVIGAAKAKKRSTGLARLRGILARR